MTKKDNFRKNICGTFYSHNLEIDRTIHKADNF